MNDNRLIRLARAFITPNAHRNIKSEVGVIASRRIHRTHSQLLKCRPVANCNISVEQRNFRRVRQRIFLFLGSSSQM